MTDETFAQDVLRTLTPGFTQEQYLQYLALKLCEEAGEVAAIIAKHLYQHHPLDLNDLIDELGDLEWAQMGLLAKLGVDLDTVRELNVQKRERRYPNGFSAEASINRS
jgi:NTP pyrophosphatase (non-canonical NTP hydrolase)